MEKKNKIILAVIVVVAVIAIIAAAMVSSKPAEDSAVVNNTKTEQKATPEPEKVKPTFVYFITQEDAPTAEFLTKVEDLKAESGDEINFDLRDLDANPEEKENFALVVGNTPAVIMLDIYNNISSFNLANPSVDDLKATIEKALGE